MLNPLQSLQKKLQDLPRLTPLVWTLIIGTAVQHFALFMCFPFFAIFLTRNLGATPMRAGLLLMIAPLIVTFGSFFCGHLADRIGRPQAMVSAMFIFALSYGGLALLAGAHLEANHSQLFFGLLETMAGFSSALYQPSSMAVIADELAAPQRAKAFRLRYSAINVGSALGPAIGAQLGLNSSSSALWLTSGMSFIFGLLIWRALRNLPAPAVEVGTAKSPVSIGAAIQQVGRDRRLACLVAAGIVFNLAYIQLECSLSQHVIGTSGYEAGLVMYSRLLSTNGLCVLLFQILFSKWIDAMPCAQAYRRGCWLFGAGALLFLAGSSFAVAMIAMALVTLGEVMIFPVGSIALDRLAPVAQRATYYGAASFRQLGTALGPALGGWVIASSSSNWIFVMMAGLAGVSYFFFGGTTEIESVTAPVRLERRVSKRRTLSRSLPESDRRAVG